MNALNILRAGLVAAGLAAALAGPAAASTYWDFATQSFVTYDDSAYMQNRVVPERFMRQTVSYATGEKPGTIIIDSRSKYLYLVTGPTSAIRYGVGVGREGFGWRGVVKVGNKAEWPTWTPPKEMIVRERQRGRILPASMKGGIDNPLGARALYLYDGSRDTQFRIHGTNEPWSIGLNVSSGCIRLNNDDVVDLYKRVGVGTKVIVM